jgi:exodeoxyribonuclease VII small subunit
LDCSAVAANLRICDRDASGGVILQETVEQLANSASLKKPAADVGSLSFEGALAELETIVDSLEKGAVDLDDSIALYERGQVLKSHCEAKLKNAETRLEKLVLGSDSVVRVPVGSEKMDA